MLDRPDLEARCCECYQVVKTEFERLLPYVTKLGSDHCSFGAVIRRWGGRVRPSAQCAMDNHGRIRLALC